MVSGVYIWSLLRLLSHKPIVRQRRVMRDLIFVKLICVAFDILTVVLVYLDRPAIIHSIQVFCYALKFKIEFIVLNQLMEVAARGLRKNFWEERRCNNTSETNDISECQNWVLSANPFSHPAQNHPKRPPDCKAPQFMEDVSILPSAKSRSNHNSTLSTTAAGIDPADLDPLSFSSGPELELKSFHESKDKEIKSPTQSNSTVDTRPSQTFSGDNLHSAVDQAREESFRHFFHHRLLRPLKSIMEHAHSHKKDQISSTQSSGQCNKVRERRQGGIPINAALRRHDPSRRRRSADGDDEEEEAGVHMWENRGKMVLGAPWFKSKEEAV